MLIATSSYHGVCDCTDYFCAAGALLLGYLELHKRHMELSSGSSDEESALLELPLRTRMALAGCVAAPEDSDSDSEHEDLFREQSSQPRSRTAASTLTKKKASKPRRTKAKTAVSPAEGSRTPPSATKRAKSAANKTKPPKGRFFGCYLLASRNPANKSSAYIGFAVNPPRVRKTAAPLGETCACALCVHTLAGCSASANTMVN